MCNMCQGGDERRGGGGGGGGGYGNAGGVGARVSLITPVSLGLHAIMRQINHVLKGQNVEPEKVHVMILNGVWDLV